MSVGEQVSAEYIVDAVVTEEDAFAVLYRLKEKFGWAGTVFSSDDIPLHIHEESRAGESELTDEPVSAQEFAAVQRTWEWREGIADAMTMRAAEMIPVVHRYEDGSFEVKEVW